MQGSRSPNRPLLPLYSSMLALASLQTPAAALAVVGSVAPFGGAAGVSTCPICNGTARNTMPMDPGRIRATLHPGSWTMVEDRDLGRGNLAWDAARFVGTIRSFWTREVGAWMRAH